ncbi:CUE domain-containing protein 2-B [Clonorchis sinensis]|uniref:CUE domain-containing protein 2-B n=1 Tax=Clonorchis sinensis TaxID=79923 RepID=A0A8T1MLF7_CLOSI|nr:CUE domain-containing protein 2-B [Clonorchis sinensis]
MNLRESISGFFAKTGVTDTSNLDEDLVTYLEESLKVCDDDVDVEGLSSVCEAYIPNFKNICRTEFTCWYAQTRAAFISSQTDNSAAQLGQPGGIRSTSSKIERTQTSATDDDSGDDNGICDTSLDALVKMFPQVCRKQLKQCLQVADGDLGKAVNLALDRAEQVTTDKAQGPPTDRGQVTSSMSPNLPDNEPNESVSTLSAEERISMLERYGIVQAERTGSLCPAPYTAAEPKSTVRYLDGKVVDTKGKKYIEIKPEYPNMPQPQFLKALRRYKKH